jgi:hypothetical protein
MKIKLLTSRSGSDGAFGVGDVIDVPQAEAIRMIEKGQAEPLREAKAPEKATKTRRKPEAK